MADRRVEPSNITATELGQKMLELMSPIGVDGPAEGVIVAMGLGRQPRIFSKLAGWLESRGCEIASKRTDRVRGRLALRFVLVNVPNLTGPVIQPLVMTMTLPTRNGH
jgi:hypothetical protein